MKKMLFTALCVVMSVFGLSAQITQTNGALSITLESTRIIGDKMVVSGKMTVDKEVRLRNIRTNAITSDGDSHLLTKFMFGGEKTSTNIFDQLLQAGIPYSFDLYFETQNMNMDPVTALMIEIRDHTAGAELKFIFPNVGVPMAPDPKLAPGEIEIGKEIYLKWTKCEESAAGLKVDFVVENRAKKDQEMAFPAINNARIIDKDGNIYPAALTLKDRVTFPVETPVAGSISIEEAVGINDVVMIQFMSSDFKYSVRTFSFTE